MNSALKNKVKRWVDYAKANRANGLVLELAESIIELAKQQNPLSFFVPNGAIEKLISSVGSNDRKWIFVLPAANSVGKSAAVINILGNIIWGPQSRWFEKERFSIWGHPKVFWYMSEHDLLKQFVCGIDSNSPSEIRKWFPQRRYEFKKASRDFYSELTTDTGWQGSFKTYDQDVKQFEAAKIGVAVFDEPPPELIFNAVLARLTMGGIILMPMTPLTHSAWTLDRLVNKATQESDVYVLYAGIEENCRQHGVRGILEHEQIERIVSQYDPDEVEARAHGKYAHLSGLVYKMLHPDLHRHSEDPGSFGQDKHRIYCICDPHDAKPPLLGWAAVDQFGHGKFVYEFPNAELGHKPFHQIKNWGMTTEEVCQEIKEIEKGFGWDPKHITRVMDPNFGNKHEATWGRTVKEQFAFYGRQIEWPLRFNTKVNDGIAAGHRAVRDLLTPNADGIARLKFGMQCQNIWYDMTHYQYDPRTGKSLERHGEGEKVAMRYKDGADLVRYLAMFLRAKKVEPEEEEELTWFEQVYPQYAPKKRRH